MSLTATDKIKIIMEKQNINQSALATILNVSRQNIAKKFKQNNMSEKDLQTFCNVLNCSYEINFIMNDTNEKI